MRLSTWLKKPRSPALGVGLKLILTWRPNSRKIKYLILFLVIITPVIAATEYAWGQSLIILTGSLIVFLLFRFFLKDGRAEVLNTLLNPLIFIFFLLGIFTVIPLPKFLLKLISPGTFHLYKEYLPSYVSSSWIFPLRSLSLYSYKTLLSMSILVTYAAVFFCLINKFDSFKIRMRLANLIIILGTFISCWGILNMHIQNDKLFWMNDIVSGIPTGPFINTIHFGHFMALCIPLTLGMWMGKIDFGMDRNVFVKTNEYRRVITGFMKDLVLYLLPAITMMVGLFKSLSRGAVVSFSFSMLVFTGVLLYKSKTRLKAILLLGVLLCGVVLALSLDNGDVLTRLQTLKSPATTDSAQTRVTVWKDDINVFKDFPVFGTGLNTFQTIFPKYKTIFGSGKMFFTHAENDYIETLSEVGMSGCIFLILIIVVFVRNVRVGFKLTNDTFKICLLAGGISSISAAAVSGLTDFIFHIPAISLIFIVICFIVWPQVGKSGKLTVLSYKDNRKGFIATMLALLVLFLFLLIFSIRVLAGQIYFCKFVHAPDNFTLKSNYIKKAAVIDSKNADYRYKYGEACFKEAKGLKKRDKGRSTELARKAKTNFDKAINLDPVNWRYYFARGASEVFLTSAGAREFTSADVRESFNKTLELNPTEYAVYEDMGEFYLYVQPARAFEYYKRLAELRPWYFGAVLNIAWGISDSPNFVREVVPDDPEFLLKYADFLESKGLESDADVVYAEVVGLILLGKISAKDRISVIDKLISKNKFKDAAECLIITIEGTGYFKKKKSSFIMPVLSMNDLLEKSETINESLADSMDPDSDVLYELAVFYYQLGDHKKSQEHFKKLIKIHTNEAEIEYKYALVLHQDGKYKEACVEFRKVYDTIKDR